MPAYKYQLKNGKTLWASSFYYVDWVGQKQHKCKRGFATKREATEWEKNFLNKESKDPTILFGSLVENYMQEMESRLKPTTLANKRQIQETKLLPYFSKMKIADITPIVIHKWQNELINDSENYSQTYLKSIHDQMSSIMNYAVKYYGLAYNPCHRAGTIGKKNADEMNFWTKEQFQAFIATEEKSGYRLAFNILFYAGLRSGELLALTPEDVLCSPPALRICKNYAIVDGEEYFLTPKTEKGNRVVTIPESLWKELKDYIDLLRLGNQDRIFYFKKTAISSEFKRKIKSSGLPEIRLHDLRHSHASLLIEIGAPVKLISERLGHESIKTTMDTYGHLYPGKDAALASQLEELMASQNSK